MEFQALLQWTSNLQKINVNTFCLKLNFRIQRAGPGPLIFPPRPPWRGAHCSLKGHIWLMQYSHLSPAVKSQIETKESMEKNYQFRIPKSKKCFTEPNLFKIRARKMTLLIQIFFIIPPNQQSFTETNQNQPKTNQNQTELSIKPIFAQFRTVSQLLRLLKIKHKSEWMRNNRNDKKNLS